jgi:hypothetical protein
VSPRLLAALGAAVLLAGCSAELDWRELHWEDGKVKVMLPGKPTKSEREVVLGGDKIALHMLQTQKSGMAFGIAYAPLPAGDSGELLTAARDALLRNIEGKLLAEREVEVRGAPGPAREFLGEGVVAGTPMVVAARLIAANGRFYEVVFVGRKDRAEEVDLPLYLGSLTLLP